MTEFTPISFNCYGVGKWSKSSKKKFVWKFLLNQKEQEIVLFFSYWTGRLRILVNGDIQVTVMRNKDLKQNYPVTVESSAVTVLHLPGNFEIAVGPLLFRRLIPKNTN